MSNDEVNPRHMVNEIYKNTLRELRLGLQNGTPPEQLLLKVESAEERAQRVEALADARAYRETLGVIFVILAVAFTYALVLFGDSTTLPWWQFLLGWALEGVAAVFVVGMAFFAGTYAPKGEELQRRSFGGCLGNVGVFLGVLAFIWWWYTELH